MTNSKEKGKRGEREVARILRDHGYDSHRTAQYCGNTGDAADVVGLDGFHIEVKRCETTKIWEWIAQAERDHPEDTIPVVVFRRSRSDWQVCISLEKFIEILKSTVVHNCALEEEGQNEKEKE